MKVYWCKAPETINSPGYISELRYPEPERLTKHINVKDFLGDMAHRCPPVTNVMQNTFVIKSPISVDLTILPNGNWDVKGQNEEFVRHFFGEPQGKKGLHQLAYSYFFFSEQNLYALQNSAVYDNNNFVRNTKILNASFDISRWFHLWKPTFLINNGVMNLSIKEGDALMYIWFNTEDKVQLVEFDDTKMRQLGEKHPSYICSTIHKHSQGVIPIPKLYEYFVRSKMNKKILKIIKESIIDS